jgi:hypothetical protein
VGSELGRVAGSLERLYGDGGLSDGSSKTLEKLKTEIVKGLGKVSEADELLLATLLIDDSLSIAPNVAEIRHGHNLMLEALRDEDTTAEVRVNTRALNRGVLSTYQPIGQAIELNTNNFSGSRLSPKGTPLYRQSLITLGTVIVKAQEEEDRGASVRTFTIIITDAEDNRSYNITAKHVEVIVKDMLELATNHIVAGMGIGERDGIDFRQVFRSMGIPERWIFTSGTSVEEIRKEFKQIIKDLRLATSSEAGFLQLAAESPGRE